MQVQVSAQETEALEEFRKTCASKPGFAPVKDAGRGLLLVVDGNVVGCPCGYPIRVDAKDAAVELRPGGKILLPAADECCAVLEAKEGGAVKVLATIDDVDYKALLSDLKGQPGEVSRLLPVCPSCHKEMARYETQCRSCNFGAKPIFTTQAGIYMIRRSAMRRLYGDSPAWGGFDLGR